MSRLNDRTGMKTPRQAFRAPLALAIILAAFASPGAPTNAPVVVEIPKAVIERKSVFRTDSKTAHDPFFPNSTRRGASSNAAKTVAPPTEIPQARPADLLALKGIAGPASRRLALVNNQLLSVGEEAYIATSSGPIKVKCVEISEDSVDLVLTINDEQQNKKLRLREGP
jgi:hypothetical protein